MATGFRNLFIAFLLVGLFFFSMVNFGIQLSNENDANSSLLDHDAINRSFNDLSSKLGSSDENASAQRENFESETPTAPSGDYILVSVIKSGFTTFSTIMGVFNTIIVLMTETLGISSVVLGVLSTILLISGIFLLWRLYKAGE